MAESKEYQETFEVLLKIFKQHFAREPGEKNGEVEGIKFATKEKIEPNEFIEWFCNCRRKNRYCKELKEHLKREPLDFEMKFIETCLYEGKDTDWMIANLPKNDPEVDKYEAREFKWEDDEEVQLESEVKELKLKGESSSDLKIVQDSSSMLIAESSSKTKITPQSISMLKTESSSDPKVPPESSSMLKAGSNSDLKIITESSSRPEAKPEAISGFKVATGSQDSMITCKEERSDFASGIYTINSRVKLSAAPREFGDKQLVKEYAQAYYNSNQNCADEIASNSTLTSHDTCQVFDDDAHQPNMEKIDLLSEEIHYYEKLIKETIFEMNEGLRSNMKPHAFAARMDILDQHLIRWYELVDVKKHSCEKYGFQEAALILYQTEWKIRTSIKDIKRSIYQHVHNQPDRLKMSMQREKTRDLNVDFSDITSDEVFGSALPVNQKRVVQLVAQPDYQGVKPQVQYSSILKGDHCQTMRNDREIGYNTEPKYVDLAFTSQRGNSGTPRKDLHTQFVEAWRDHGGGRNASKERKGGQYYHEQEHSNYLTRGRSNERSRQEHSFYPTRDRSNEVSRQEHSNCPARDRSNEVSRQEHSNYSTRDRSNERQRQEHSNYPPWDNPRLKLNVPKLDATARIKEFFQFKSAFENLMKQTNQSGNGKLVLLQQSIENKELKSAIMDLPFSEDGYQFAMSTLETRFGGKQNLVASRLAEIERFSEDTGRSKGLFNLSVLLKSILADTSFRGEITRQSLLYSKAISKLPREIQDKYLDRYDEEYQQNLDTLRIFIERFAKRRMEQESLQQLGPRKDQTKPLYKTKHFTYTNTSVATDDKKQQKKYGGPCANCQGPHYVFACLKEKPLHEVERVVREKKLCYNCLSNEHGFADCSSKQTCKKCQKRHNTLLHKDYLGPKQGSLINRDYSGPKSTTPVTSKAEQNEIRTENYFVKPMTHGVKGRLPVKYSAFVVPVNAQNIKSGHTEETIVYFDQGADETWITTELAKSLKLEPIEYSDCNIITVTGEERYKDTPIVELVVQSLDKKAKYKLTCRVMDNIPQCSYQDWSRVKKKYQFLSKVPVITTSAHRVGICIGRDNCHLLMPEEIIEGGKNQPKAFKMKLGWTICVPKQQDDEDTECNFIQTRAKLGDFFKGQVRFCQDDFMKEEETSKSLDVITNEAMRKMLTEDNLVIEEKPPFNKDEETAFNFVRDHFEYTSEGRPIIAIPFNEKIQQLGNNYPAAYGRLKSQIIRLEKAGITEEFEDKIKDGISKDYYEEIEDRTPQVGRKFYIPTDAVIRTDRETNRLRIVNNGAATWQGISLNDTIRAGPNLQEDMIQIIIRFRKEKKAISMDVSEMFPQVIVRPEDRDWLRFLFKAPGDTYCKIFRHKRLAFGLNCSPFIAQYTVIRTAEQYKDELKLGYQIIKDSRYVDDVIASLATTRDAEQALHEALMIFRQCGMEVHKVLSNDTEVLESVDEKKRLKQWTQGQELPSTKILGMLWNPNTDQMNIVDPKEEKCPISKRGLLTSSAKLYDPQGLISPFSVKARRLLQRLWSTGVNWDEELPSDLQPEVSAWFQQLGSIENIEFPRKIAEGNPKSLHIFADASDYAYGFAAYLQTDSDCGLIIAKARVHSLKPKSIPRKELQAAVLASKTVPTLRAVWPNIDITLWTDSQNCLAWIQSDSRQYNAYINNRISAILDHSVAEQWRWVDTANNPADIASRGMDLELLKESKLWWKGPKFLRERDIEWPTNKRYFKTDEELKANVIKDIFVNYTRIDWLPEIQQYDTLQALVDETAKVYKEINNLNDSISAQDKEYALQTLIKDAQAEIYSKEINELKHGRQVPARSHTSELNPALDSDGILRGISRLESELIPEDTAKPVLLPKNHHLTKLIIKHEHEKTRHAYGTDYAMSEIRRKYWIPAARQQVKKFLKDCRQCKLYRGLPNAPKMAPLPFIRTEGTGLPFTHASVDFSGAYLTKQGRGQTRQKRYLCLFCCNETRAVHLELAYNLETDGFIQALNNFTCRRGRIKTLTCDNGTNFRGAERELKSLIEGLNPIQLQDYASSNGFKFRFNPPGAPHMGGVFESLIKSSKRAIRAVLKNAEFTDGELISAFNEAENILNSRPLGYQSNDPNDFRTLTPASFLHGRLDGSILPPVVDNQNFDIRQRWRHVQLTLKHIWTRWIKEILPNLGPRQKWTQDRRNFEVGDEVLVMDKNLPRYRWNIGRITATFPGRDGVVRVVNVRGEDGDILQKTVHRLIPLS